MKKFKWILSVAVFGLSLSTVAQINVNTATVDELRLLKGFGVKKAEAIVLYRKEHGDFANVSDLVNVKGVSQKLLDSLADDLTVSEQTNLSTLKHRTAQKKSKSNAHSTKSSTASVTAAKKSEESKSAEKPDEKEQSNTTHKAHATEKSAAKTNANK